MNKALVMIGGFGAGAGLMYLADPHEGRRRRARVREMAAHASHVASDAAGTTSRDARHRLSGVAARTLGHLVAGDTPDDGVLVARVRARVGRLVSHPHAIEIHASGGRITVSGPVFEAEVGPLLDGIGAVAGVLAVDNRLQAYAEAGNVPALQGPGPKRVSWMSRAWPRWSPAVRFAAAVAGIALVVMSTPQRGVKRTATGIMGMQLLEHAVGRRA